MNIPPWAFLILLILSGALVFYTLLPAVTHPHFPMRLRHKLAELAIWWKIATRYGTELGGYVHDTAMSQYIPPTTFNFVTGTWTQGAGAVSKTIAVKKAAAAQTSIVTIPIMVPSNSVNGKGAYLKSIEVDYEILIADLTSITPLVNLVSRGVDLAVATVAAQTFTQSPTLALSVVTDQHKLVITITAPFWVANTQYVLLELTMVAPATSTIDMLGAVANFTEKL